MIVSCSMSSMHGRMVVVVIGSSMRDADMVLATSELPCVVHTKVTMNHSTGTLMKRELPTLHRVVNVSVRPGLVFVRPCQLDRPLVRPTSIRVTTR